MFNLFKKTSTPKLVIAEKPSDPEEDRQNKMYEEQLALQKELGIEEGNNAQGWLRLHQILKSHADRIAALEKKDE